MDPLKIARIEKAGACASDCQQMVDTYGTAGVVFNRTVTTSPRVPLDTKFCA